jgi:aminoglycoside N3'-acetyltransferase
MSSPFFTKEDIIEALTKLNLLKGDIVWVFSSLGFLGRPQGAKSIEDVCRIFYEAIREVIGEEGTIIVPTYSYTIGRNLASEPVLYDPSKIKAEIGPFPEWFRKQKNVIRSLDPMMPIAGQGPLAKEILRNLPPNSYGHDSVYERLLYYPQTKILTLGLGPNWIPFIHYLDWLHKVPFRYDKLFTGAVKDKNQSKYINWIYPVRTLIEESYPWAYRAGELAKKTGLCKFSPLGKSGIYACDYRSYLLKVYQQMKKDKWFLAKGPRVDVFLAELDRLKEKPYKVDLPEYEPKKWLEILSSHRRDTVSLSTDAVLDAIRNHFREFQLKEIPTGEYCLDWIVPERWSIYSAKIVDAQTDEVIVDLKDHPAVVYSYSKPFKGVISKETLLKHIATSEKLPDARVLVNVMLDRDWGFSLTKEEISKLNGSKYYVEIESDFSLAKLRYLESFFEGDLEEEIVFVAFIEGPYRVNEHLSGLLAILELLQWLKENKPLYSVRLLILPSPVALACWLEHSRENLRKVKGFVILTMLGKEDIITIQTTDLKNSIVRKLIKTLQKNKKPYQLLPQGLYQPLVFGGNPFVYYPHKEELLKKMELINEKFGIEPRKDFFHTPEEIYELEIPNKLIVLGRTLPANAFYFPFKGYKTDKDTIEDIDIEKIIETVDILKEVLLQE